MVTVEVLQELGFFRGLRSAVLDRLAAAAQVVEFDNNTLVTRQHDRAIALFVLLSGHVQFLIDVEGSGKLLVGVGRGAGLILGWSVFRAPFRYMTDVRCEGPCRLLRIPHHLIDELLEEYYTLFYGPAANAMRAAFTFAEQQYTRLGPTRLPLEARPSTSPRAE